MSKGENFAFFPKYTTVIDMGTSYDFYSDPWEVLPYNEITVEIYMAAMPIGVASVQLVLQESNDLKEWNPIGGFASVTITTSGTTATIAASRTARWIRMVLTNFSSSALPAYFVLWAKGVARNV